MLIQGQGASVQGVEVCDQVELLLRGVSESRHREEAVDAQGRTSASQALREGDVRQAELSGGPAHRLAVAAEEGGYEGASEVGAHGRRLPRASRDVQAVLSRPTGEAFLVRTIVADGVDRCNRGCYHYPVGQSLTHT